MGEVLAGPAPAGRMHNLPAGLTSFLGRASESARVEAMLARHRLVTVTGPGGSGKTRVAIEVARALVPRFDDGVWLVELAQAEARRLARAARTARPARTSGPRRRIGPVRVIRRAAAAAAAIGAAGMLMLTPAGHTNASHVYGHRFCVHSSSLSADRQPPHRWA